MFFKDCAESARRCRSALSTRAHPSDLWNWMDGQRKAGNELLAISHNANLSDGHMFPIDVDSKGRPIDAAWAAVARPQRAADRDQADQGHVGDPSAAFAQRRVRQLRDSSTTCSVIPKAASRPSPAATFGRRSRTASRCRTRAATTRTRSGFVGGSRLAQHGVCLTGRRTFSAATRGIDGHHQGAHGRHDDSRASTCDSKNPAGLSGRLGRGEHARSRSSRPCSARRRSAPAARASRSASSAAGIASAHDVASEASE